MFALEVLGNVPLFGEAIAAANLCNPATAAAAAAFKGRSIYQLKRAFSIKCVCSGDASSTDTVPLADDVFSVTSSSKCDVDYLGESTKGDLNLKLDPLLTFGISSAFLPSLDFPLCTLFFLYSTPCFFSFPVELDLFCRCCCGFQLISKPVPLKFYVLYRRFTSQLFYLYILVCLNNLLAANIFYHTI